MRYLSLLLLLILKKTEAKEAWKFGMASGGSSFFDPIGEGFMETCALLNETNHDVDVECHYFAENATFFRENYSEQEDLRHCVPQIRQMMAEGYDGISLYCGVDHPVLQEARDQGIVLSSFDITPKLPMPYVGTNNEVVGVSMARLLRLLKHIEPGQTGKYYAFSFRRIPARYQRFVQEIEKNNHRADKGHWRMITTNLTGNEYGDDLEMGEELHTHNNTEVLDRLALLNPDAIIFMNQSPMRRDGYAEWVQRNRHRGITMIGLQGSDEELQTLARRNVDGLIGQVTFDIGRLSAQTLYDLKAGKDVPPVQFTNLINYNLVPKQLPDLELDQNLLGGLKIVGYICFALVAATSLACMVWTCIRSKGTVVRSSQPLFLLMMATGVLIMASSILPLSFDASDEQDFNEHWAKAICMSVPWLACIGFSITFAALFSKTWRINKFFNSNQRFGRIQVREYDVLAPLAVVLSLNLAVLITWTIVDPLTYTREFEDGTDMFNREIASNGYCRSDHAEYFLIPLALINLTVLVIACWQAYNARNIKSEFAEASYIALAVFILGQAFATGIPVVAIVKDDPQAFYLVLVAVLFVLSMAVLLLIFLPKIIMDKRYSTMTPAEQRKSLAVSVRASTTNASSSLRHGHNEISGLYPPPPPRAAGGEHFQAHATPEAREVQAIPEVKSESKAQELSSTDRDGTNSSTDRDGTNSSTDRYGSYVSRVDDDDVSEVKQATYASKDLDADLLQASETQRDPSSNTDLLHTSETQQQQSSNTNLQAIPSSSDH